MLGNFSYVNPTKLYFGEDALSHLHEELSNYGNRILLVYGGGSIKKNGVYDAVCEILEKKSTRMAESCQILPWKSCGKAVTLHEKIRWISYWQLEAAPYAIMPRLYLFPFIAKKIRGRNIICGWRMSPVRLFQ